jgi:hypothetical protein
MKLYILLKKIKNIFIILNNILVYSSYLITVDYKIDKIII